MNTPQCIYTLYNALAVMSIMKIEPAASIYTVIGIIEHFY